LKDIKRVKKEDRNQNFFVLNINLILSIKRKITDFSNQSFLTLFLLIQKNQYFSSRSIFFFIEQGDFNIFSNFQKIIKNQN